MIFLTHVLVESVRHRKKIFLLSLVGFFTPIYFYTIQLPRRFQSTAVFNFHSDFSKVPASSEFFAELYDPNEIRAEKEAVLLGVLSDQFLIDLAKKHLDSEAAQKEWFVQGMRRDIRFVPLSRTTYQLVVNQGSAVAAERIARDVIEKLQDNLRNERLVRMHAVYESMTQQLSELTIYSQDENTGLQLEAARARIQDEITKLESMYTSEHPRLVRLRSQLDRIRERTQHGIMEPIAQNSLARGHLENWASLRGILITRQALLQVAIRMEEKGSISHIKVVKEPDHPQWPSEPKTRILLISGALTSGVLASAVSAIVSILADIRALLPGLNTAWRSFRDRLSMHNNDSGTDGEES